MTSIVSNNVIRWFESVALDKPELRSPQPCKRGIHCDYKLKDEASGELVRACCSGVHPGEEGTGRRLFPARTLDDGREQPACVRLTGAAQGFYERRRRHLSWAEWCEEHGIPFSPALPGQPFEPVFRSPLGGKKPDATIQAAMELCQPYMRERHPMQEHASIGGSTAFGLNPRAFDVMAQQNAEQEFNLAAQPWGGREYRASPADLDPRMMSRGFLGMPGGAEAARIASGSGSAQPQAGQPSKNALKNARKRANKKAAASAAAAQAAVQAAAEAAAQPQPYIHSLACIRHSGQRPLAWGPEPEGGCLCAGINATIAHNRAVAAAATPQLPPALALSGSPLTRQRFAVTGRGGECSPDCCCPSGVSCHDRDTPDWAAASGGTASPMLFSTAGPSQIDFEAQD